MFNNSLRLFIHIVDYLFVFYDCKIHVSLTHYEKNSSLIIAMTFSEWRKM